MVNVDDPSETTFYIPYTPADEPDNRLENAYRAAYQQSWLKCSHILTSKIEEEFDEKRQRIVSWLLTAHDDELPGVFQPQLPLLAVHRSDSRFTRSLLPRLSAHSAIAHLHPSDAPTVAAALRALVSQFVSSSPSSSDIRLLDVSDDPLLVVCYDFEQFDPSVMQDVFHICSTRIPALRLAFLAFLSSPLTSSYIHTVYPRSTLTRLRVHSLSVHAALLEKLLLAAFFDPAFEPDLVLGPSALQAIVDYHTRHNSSIDALTTCLQLSHLKHFLTEPLSILVHPPSTLSTDPVYVPVLALLSSRLPGPSTTESLLHAFQECTSAFRAASHAVRLGFTVLYTVHNHLVSNGYRTPYSGPQAITDLMISVLSGPSPREIKSLVVLVHKLRHEALHALLTELHNRDPGQDHSFLTRTRTATAEQVGVEVSTWLSTYLISLLKPLTKYPLWDIYFTGTSPFPSELLNPCPRATVISALLDPGSFTEPLVLPGCLQQRQDEVMTAPTIATATATTETKEGHRLFDTSILFQRYLDGARVINVYDWYVAFKVGLDAQRAERVKGKEKGKEKAGEVVDGDDGDDGGDDDDDDGGEEEEVDDDGEEEEAWQREVQARFWRALHELDYLGFVQHTKRKAEHVVRTVLDVGEG